MGREAKKEKQETVSDVADKVVVAVKASKEIPKTALVWALTHVVQPGDCITLLVVVYSPNSGRKFWGFARLSGGCASAQKFNTGTSTEQKYEIKDSCSQMILQLQDVYDPNKVNVKVKIISGSSSGAVAAEAKRCQANWVILDKQLKHEEKHCMEELQCNIVVMKRSQPKVLRLNLVGTPKRGPRVDSVLTPQRIQEPDRNGSLNPIPGPAVTPSSSPDLGTPFTATEPGVSSTSSSDQGNSPLSMSEESKKGDTLQVKEHQDCEVSNSGTDRKELHMPSANTRFQPWVPESQSSNLQNCQHIDELSQRLGDNAQVSARTLLGTISEIDREDGIGTSSRRSDIDFNGNVREAISLSRSARAPPGPPPLCSICKHKAPVFGKPPKWFSYAELELATGGFSEANFLAEGGYGSVHRGVLPDGQPIAVKQHKLASSQGDREFCSEVEVLSCAQHRNVVMLIGFCIEDSRRLLVYEYICNGSLDYHLYGEEQEPLEWPARYKIATGAARGLRYLHEECRVGCIIHRDMRPNNILLTHDFEPLVGDFGLARWQPDGDTGVETRVIGTFGYLAPEYAQIGQITDKADVYSFGVVLVELVTGRKAVDLSRPKGQQCLTEWARPLLEGYAIHELIDPRLGDRYSENEVYCMLRAASLCIRKDPHDRPRMSQVLRILEGDTIMDTGYMSTPSYDVGIQSGRISIDQPHPQHQFSGPLRVLESDSIADSGYISIPGCCVGNQCGEFKTLHQQQQQQHNSRPLHAVEGDSTMDMGYLSVPSCYVRNENKIINEQQQQQQPNSPFYGLEGDSLIETDCATLPGCDHGNQNGEEQKQFSSTINVLKGDSTMNTSYISVPGCNVIDYSKRISTEQQQRHSSPLHVLEGDCYMSNPGYNIGNQSEQISTEQNSNIALIHCSMKQWN